MVTCQSSTGYWKYFEDYWPCAGGISAVNAIGTKLRDTINSGLTPCRIWFELINGRRRGNREESCELITSFSLGVENEKAGAGTAEPGSRGQILMRERGQGNVYFRCSADREQDSQPYPVDPYFDTCDDHTYIHTYLHTYIHTYILHFISGFGKREAHINWSMVKTEKADHYWNCLGEYWPCAAGLSAVNAVGGIYGRHW